MASVDTIVLSLLLLLALISVTVTTLFPGFESPALLTKPETSSPARLSDLLRSVSASTLARYPTDLTRDIYPKPIHSHNDYWREAPVYTSLSVGAVSIEADVWLHDDEGALLVGHERSALTSQRTFQSLYVKPLMDILERMNPKSDYVTFPNSTFNGVFDVASSQTFYLWVDLKSAGLVTFRALIAELEPLRKRGWLSFIQDGRVMQRPVTVIGTGHTPLDELEALGEGRDVFYDAPIDLLSTKPYDTLTSITAPFASGQYSAIFGHDLRNSSGLSGDNLVLLRKQISDAHKQGILVRYWETPAWPKAAKEGTWRQLWEEGVDLLNADDLEDIAKSLWR